MTSYAPGAGGCAMRRTAALLMLLAATGLAGCTGQAPPAPGGAPAASMDAAPSAAPSAAAPPSGAVGSAGGADRSARGTFALYTLGASAISYDPALVPPGSTATLTVDGTGRTVTVRMTVTGLVPGRRYGAHLHTNVCGASVGQAGPHYQQLPDPAAVASPPSVDPRYANPVNEVWLDLSTDVRGAGAATAKQPWAFDGINPPRSLVLHADPTQRAPGRAGSAGARVACLTLPG